MKQKIILVGGFHEIIELCEQNDITILGILDNRLSGTYRGYNIWGGDSHAELVFRENSNIPVIITPDSPSVRRGLFQFYDSIGFKFHTLISRNATISPSAQVGTGAVIQSGVNVSSEAHIGNFVKLNSMCNIMHNAIIEDFSTVAPNAVVLGNAEVARECYVGSNATILPNIRIAEKSVIGAGAVVTKDVSHDCVVAGVPAHPINSSRKRK